MFVQVFKTHLLLAAQDTDTCEVIPKNQTVKLGSDVTVVFKAPLSGICRNKLNDFHPSKVFWTLNSKKIEESYYDHNSTYARVTIANFSLESGTVESHMYGQVLGGTIVRTYGELRGERDFYFQTMYDARCMLQFVCKHLFICKCCYNVTHFSSYSGQFFRLYIFDRYFQQYQKRHTTSKEAYQHTLCYKLNNIPQTIHYMLLG